jgi:hypothetical protein
MLQGRLRRCFGAELEQGLHESVSLIFAQGKMEPDFMP